MSVTSVDWEEGVIDPPGPVREGGGKRGLKEMLPFCGPRHPLKMGLSFCPEATCPVQSYVNIRPEASLRTGRASQPPDPNQDRYSASSHKV